MHPFFSQKQLLHLLTLLTSSRLLLLGKAQTSLALRSLNRSLAFVAFVENAKNRLFFMPGRIACLSTKSRTPENPSNLPQNRFKCLRRTFIPPRQKLALYGALKRAVKIL